MPVALNPAGRFRRVFLAGALALLVVLFFSARASASPSALNILIVSAVCGSETANSFTDSVAAQPGVAKVDVVVAGVSAECTDPVTPTAATLEQYDAVIFNGWYAWEDPIALGDAAADYIDHGGVAITPNWNYYDPGDDYGYALLGRFSSGGYGAFAQWQLTPSAAVTLGPHDGPNAIFAGVSTLTNLEAYTTSVASGATLLASWDNGQPAVAIKGQVFAYNGNFVDGEGSGDEGPLVVNAIKALGYHPLSVSRAGGNGSGVISSTPGTLTCTTTCDGEFLAGKSISLTAVPAKRSVFAGWSGGCNGNSPTCTYVTTYPGNGIPVVTNSPITAKFSSVKLKYGKYRKGRLSVRVPGAGKLQLKASGVKTVKFTVKKSGTAKLKIKLSKKLKAKLAKKKRLKLKFKFAYTPTGAAAPAKSTKTITLKK